MRGGCISPRAPSVIKGAMHFGPRLLRAVLDMAEDREALAYLKLQVPVEQRKGRCHVRPDLRELVEGESGPIGT
jgi:hypothetical protein